MFFFAEPINFVCTKVSRSVGMLRKLTNFMPRKSLKCLIFRMISPHFINAIEVLGFLKSYSA